MNEQFDVSVYVLLAFRRKNLPDLDLFLRRGHIPGQCVS